MIKTIENSVESTKKAMTATIGLNFIICLLFGASMSNMW